MTEGHITLRAGQLVRWLAAAALLLAGIVLYFVNGPETEPLLAPGGVEVLR